MMRRTGFGPAQALSHKSLNLTRLTTPASPHKKTSFSSYKKVWNVARKDINVFKIRTVGKTMTENFILKMAVIAGASNALKLKAQNPKWTDEKILQDINREVKEIVNKLER